MQGLAQEGEAAFRRAAAAFRDLPAALLDKEQTIVYGQFLGHVAGVIGLNAEAQGYYRQALEIVAQTGAVPVALDIFLGCALLLGSKPIDTQYEQTLELLTLVQDHPATTSETREKA